MEYIYRLDLPPIQDVVIADQFNSLLNNTEFKANGYTTVAASQIFQSVWLNIQDLAFTTVSCFYKHNFAGRLHADDRQRVRGLNERALWAITWIYQGTGVMEYWRPENISGVSNTPQRNGVIQLCETSKTPDKIYTLVAGHPYLTNVSVPHRPTGLGPRYAFSLRTEPTYQFYWADIVQQFESLIIR